MPAKTHTMHGRDHCPEGADPIPCLPPAPFGDDLADLILATSPDAFWKLNELAGTVAHDSSGNDNHLLADGLPPEWGQTAGPPGDTTAKWVDDDNRVNGSLTTFTDDFTAGVWVNLLEAPTFANELIGQGGAAHSGAGWSIMTRSATSKFEVWAGSGILQANNPLDVDTWYFVAVVRDAGTWKLYIEGLLQAATITDSPGTGYGGNTWLGNDGSAAHTTYSKNVLLSYGFITSTVLTSTDLLAMVDIAASGGAIEEGAVLTSDGAGGSTWALPTLAVTY